MSVLAETERGRYALSFGADAHGAPVTPASLYLVASITKLATALTVLRLVDSGHAALDDPLARYAPEARAAQPGITLRTLLCHTSGLPQDIPNGGALYGTPLTWTQLAELCLQVEPVRPPRTRVVYGNVGYGLLAVAVERITRQPFSAALETLVLSPLGIEGYLGVEPPRPPVWLADVRGKHASGEFEPLNSAYYRALGFPWAGLVTTADGVLTLVRAFAGDPEFFLSESLRLEATRNQTDDLGGGYGEPFVYERSPWGLGVELRDDKTPHWTPSQASPETFGHAGASGCVVWHDPVKRVSWAILGTRTADNGWLVRGGPSLGAAILEMEHGQTA